MFCIAGICSSGMFSSGVVVTSAQGTVGPSSQASGRALSTLYRQRSLVAALKRDDWQVQGGQVGSWQVGNGKVGERQVGEGEVRDEEDSGWQAGSGKGQEGKFGGGEVTGWEVRGGELGRSIIKKKEDKEYGRIIEIAEREIGVLESGCQNCGASVAGYLNYVGIRYPAPWCAAWVSWCHGQAGYPQPRTGWSPALFPRERIVREPRAGSVFGIYFPELKRVAHCGIVAGLKGNYVQAIEGNTNVSGAREGIGVFRKLRHKRSIAQYADWIRAVPP